MTITDTTYAMAQRERRLTDLVAEPGWIDTIDDIVIDDLLVGLVPIFADELARHVVYDWPRGTLRVRTARARPRPASAWITGLLAEVEAGEAAEARWVEELLASPTLCRQVRAALPANLVDRWTFPETPEELVADPERMMRHGLEAVRKKPTFDEIHDLRSEVDRLRSMLDTLPGSWALVREYEVARWALAVASDKDLRRRWARAVRFASKPVGEAA